MKVVTVARKPCSEGSTTQNVVEHGTGALNVDACRIESVDPFGGGTKMSSSGQTLGQFADRYAYGSGWVPGSSLGRWPANVILQGDEVVEDLGEQSGERPVSGSAAAGRPASRKHSQQSIAFGQWSEEDAPAVYHSDTGTASRYFKKVGMTPRDDGSKK